MRSQATYKGFSMHHFLVYYCVIDIFPGTLTAYVKLSESLFNSAISCS